MDEFRHLSGAVYIFENSKAQRVKVGMTINDVADRLSGVNNEWTKITCQICGGRRWLNIQGYLTEHVWRGRPCPGGNALPLEKDSALAKSYLEDLKNRLSDLSGSKKGSATRIVNNLAKRIERYQNNNRPVGKWKKRVVFYTKSAEQVELLSHEILDEHLDKMAPIGEVFCCSVSVATEAIETALNQLELLHSARKEYKSYNSNIG